jgi:hypothetical protein
MNADIAMTMLNTLSEGLVDNGLCNAGNCIENGDNGIWR